ncbi:MAG: glycosyltransferase family 2 protein [Raineya sp.]
MPPLFSIVSPVYEAESLIDTLVERISKELCTMSEQYEVVLVDDGSSDGSWLKIEENAQKDARVKGIKLSRNFGQHYAIAAGLQAAKGEWVVVMDCDLQDQPEEIPTLYLKAQEGYDVVLAQRLQRQDSFAKRFFSWLFYRLLSYLTGIKQDPSIANFGIYHQRVVKAINQMPESLRYFPTMVRWVGFRQTQIAISHQARQVGKSSYNFSKRLNLAVNIILAYSDKPIRLAIKLGFSIALLAFMFAIITFVRYFSGEIKVLGYTSLIISISFFAGLIMSTLGIVGLYVGKTFESVKQRPLYIVEKKINF